MASGSFYKYPTGNFGLYCTWSSTTDASNNQSKVTLKTYLSYYTISIGNSTCTTSINGVSDTFTMPATKVSSASSWTKKLVDTRTVTVKHNSDGTKKVALSASYPFNGTYSGVSIGTITASATVTLDSIKTDCSAPTTFTATGVDGFDTSVKLSWSGAKSGIGNAIKGYQIRYRKIATSSDDWGSWTDLTTISSTATSGNTTIDMSSKISRGHYVQFAIRTLGSAGSSYYSDWEFSSTLIRKYFTKCTAPTSFSLSSNPFDKNVTLTWSGAGNGTNNTISSYHIQYNTSANNSTWDGWKDLISISSTSASGNKTIDMSSKVSVGCYVKFQIRTQGNASGDKIKTSDYYSGYKASSTIRRIARCVNPTSLSATPNPFNSSVKLSWSGAKGVTSNAITSYYIQYCTSTDNKTWGSWAGLKTVESTATSGNVTIDLSSKVDRGKYVKFQIRTQGSAGSTYYPTDYKELKTGIQRIAYTACTPPTTLDVSPSTFENSVTLVWSGATSGTNNSISSYKIQYRTSSDNKTWGSWNDSIESDSSPAEINMSSVTRGYYVQFRIRTCGSAGSSYDNLEYKTSSSIQRNPYTKCITPTTFSVSPNPFDYSVTLNWSGADNGSNNNILYYEIQYCTSPDNKTWSEWGNTTTKYTSNKTSSKIVDMSSITRGHYVKFRIRTCGSVSGYDSDNYKISSSIQRNLYSICTPPTNIILESNGIVDTTKKFDYIFNDKINISWSGDSIGDNVTFTSYYIQYQVSNSANTWGSTWSNLTSSTTTSIQVNPTLMKRGQYIRFRIQTRCNNSSYNSDYSDPTYAMKRVNIPSDISTITISSSEFSSGDNVNISWGYYSNDYGTNYVSPIAKYRIYGRCLDKNMNPLSDWQTVTDLSMSKSYKNGNAVSVNLKSFPFYNNIKNETYAEIAIIPYDAFGNVGAKNIDTCAKARVFRYDRSGVSIGINGRWIPCQIYYGVDGAWIQCDVSAGVESSWKQCSG